MAATELSALADYAAQTWLREARSSDPPPHPLLAESQEVVEELRQAAIERRARALAIRGAVRDRHFLGTLDLMTEAGAGVSLAYFRFLERAFPLMTESERANCLRPAWCLSKFRLSPVRGLRLFRAASSLRDTVPTDWPAVVRVFRGARSHPSHPNPWRRAKRKARYGISWTTDRAIAATFAGRPGDAGCLGTATVSRDVILAYFQQEDFEIDGRHYPVEGYHEHECVIDPSEVGRITYGRVNSATEKSAG